MANKEQLKILKQDVTVWNKWREEHPDVEIDLSEASLDRARLDGASLDEVKLDGAKLVSASLVGASLDGASLDGATLIAATLIGASLIGASLKGTVFQYAQLAQTNLNNANITGVCLYGTSCDDWKIDGIKCDFVYWANTPAFFKNEEQKQRWEQEFRFPKDRDFHPGEFEKRYKQLPTFEYVFEQDFTPVDAVIMNQTVQMINQKHPEFELHLDSLHSRGQPHAIFTVLQKEYVETALKQITMFYEEKLVKIEGKREQLWEAFTLLTNQPQINIQELIMGNQTNKIAGRDFYEHGVAPHESTEATSQQEEEEQQSLTTKNNQKE